MEYDLDNSIRIIKAITILHKMCFMLGDFSLQDWDEPHVTYQKLMSNSQPTDGNKVHQALTDYFVTNPL